MHELTRMSASELAAGYRRRDFSPVEVVAAIAELADTSAACNALTTDMLDSATSAAASAEVVFASGQQAPPLLGIPFVVKDVFDVAGEATSCGSRVISAAGSFGDATVDATAVSRLTGAGAVLIGKTNTYEFAWGITSDNDLLGACLNPWDTDRTSGGSSSGSAVAVAVGLAPIALGTDTAGSIRIPAGFCGVTGLRPTLGRISTSGVFPLSRSFDTVGILARQPSDISLVSAVVSGPDAADPGTYLVAPQAGSVTSMTDFRGLRVGVASIAGAAAPTDGIASALASSLAVLETLGAELVEVDLPSADELMAAFAPIQAAEAHAVHHTAGLYPRLADHYSPLVRTRLESGAAVTVGDYLSALERRSAIHAAMTRVMADVDVVVSLVSPVPPPLLGSEPAGDVAGDGLRQAILGYTTAQILAGLPACSVPIGFDELQLPVGLQLTGVPAGEEVIVSVAQLLQGATPDVAGVWPESCLGVPVS